jgi:hypothetical protein
MYGLVEEKPTAIESPSGLKATLRPKFVGSVAGSAYLVPKPELDHGYARMKGVTLLVTAIAEPSGLKATPLLVFPGSVAGLAYLVPKAEPVHG